MLGQPIAQCVMPMAGANQSTCCEDHAAAPMLLHTQSLTTSVNPVCFTQ
jgi:hypothetical protein